MSDRSIMIIAGEISGDMHAGRLVGEILSIDSCISFFGIGGDNMRGAGVDTFMDISEMAVTGFAEVLKRYPFFRRVFRQTLQTARERKPDLALLVDYPGFNLRLARKLHSMGTRVLYYICPQVWAWKQSRIPSMARDIDMLLTIFPFEKNYFINTPLKVEFVGHPLVDEAETILNNPDAIYRSGREITLALLPGSREHEVIRHLPVMCSAAELLTLHFPDMATVIAAPSPEITRLIEKLLKNDSIGQKNLEIVTDRTREVLRGSSAAIVASGTATIETAMMMCPMSVIYKSSRLTYALGKRLISVPYLGMVNIIAGREICPEFIQDAATPASIATAMTPLLTDTRERSEMLTDLRKVKNSLGKPGASARAALAVTRAMEHFAGDIA